MLNPYLHTFMNSLSLTFSLTNMGKQIKTVLFHYSVKSLQYLTTEHYNIPTCQYWKDSFGMCQLFQASLILHLILVFNSNVPVPIIKYFNFHNHWFSVKLNIWRVPNFNSNKNQICLFAESLEIQFQKHSNFEITD